MSTIFQQVGELHAGSATALPEEVTIVDVHPNYTHRTEVDQILAAL